MKRENKIKLVEKLVKKAKKCGNYENDSCGMYYSDSQLMEMIWDAMSKSEVKKVINQSLELRFEFCDYRNSSGNLCGRYEELYLYVNGKYSGTLYSTYDKEYEKEWCR